MPADIMPAEFRKLRGKVAIVGIGEPPMRRDWPGRTDYGLCAEAAAMAIQDAGLEPTDIDCLVTLGAGQQPPGPMADYIGLPNIRLALGSTQAGSSAGAALITVVNLIGSGLVRYALGTFGGARDVAVVGQEQRMAALTRGSGSPGGEFGRGPFGTTVAANDGYGHMYTRHMHEFGTTMEQLAKIAVNQRFNTLNIVERSFFAAQGPITVQDVLAARYTNYPITLLQSVMPVAGAIAWVATSADRAKSHPHKPAYILGIGLKEYSSTADMHTRWVEPGVKYSSRIAYEMSGYGPNDMDFANFYD